MARKQKLYHYLYKTTNNVNGKFYIGMHSTNNLEDGYLGSGKYIQNSLRSHGRDKFTLEKLQFFDSRELLVDAERTLVNSDLLKDTLCMNLMCGGYGRPPGYKTSIETKAKISAILSKRIHTEQSKKKRSKKAKDKIAAGHKWGVFTDAAVEKIKKTVLQYKDGILVREWPGVIDIAVEFPNLCLNHISNCCRGVRKSHGGFTWKYKNVDDVVKYKNTMSKNKRENSNITKDKKQAEKFGLSYERFLELRKQKTRFDKWDKFLTENGYNNSRQEVQ